MTQEQDSWGECPRGIVGEMAAQLRRRRRQQQVRPFVAWGLAALLIAAAGYGMLGGDESDLRARLTCREAVTLFAKYHDQSLEPDAAKDVREHLSHCAKCRQRYDEKYPSEVRTRPPVASQRIAFATPYRR